MARDTGARVLRIDDGGITGPAFFDHARGSRRRVLSSPKGQTMPVVSEVCRPNPAHRQVEAAVGDPVGDPRANQRG